MTASVVQVIEGTLVASDAATVTSTLSNAIVAGDVVVALIASNASNTDHSMAGLGATWARAGKDSLGLLDLWVGTGATATGTVTATLTTSASGGFKYLNLWHVRGTTAAFVGGADNATADTLVGTAMTAGPGQIFIGSGYAEASAYTFDSPNPATGWVNTGSLLMAASRRASRVHRIPTAQERHYFSTFRSGSTAHPIVRIVIGTSRTNHVKNPSIETDMVGYHAQFPSISTLSRDTTQAMFGTASLKNVGITGSGNRVFNYGLAASGGTIVANGDSAPTVPGEVWTFSAYIKRAAGSWYFQAQIQWFTAAGVFISSPTSANLQYGTSWTRISITGTAPADAAFLGVDIIDADSNPHTVYTDGWLLEKSATVGDYFDGSFILAGQDHAWLGTPHASKSTQIPNGATVRTNLFKNPSLEVNVLQASNATQAGSTTIGVVAGTRSLAITPTNSSNDSYADINLAGTIYPGLSAGVTYTLSGYITLTAPQGGTPHPARARSFDVFTKVGAAGYVENLGTAAPNTAGTHRISVTFTPPAGYTELFIRLYNGATLNNGIVYWDAILMEVGSTVGNYFDGSTVSSGFVRNWTGTAHDSTSQEAATVTTVTLKNREAGVWVSRTAVPKVRVAGAWVIERPKRWNAATSAWVDLN